MADPLCAKCSRPILSTDNKSTLQQVDACTMAVEHLTYHSTCWDQKTAQAEMIVAALEQTQGL